MADVKLKPTVARIVHLYTRHDRRPWPAIVVEVRGAPMPRLGGPKVNPDDLLVDVQPFPPRGHGAIALLTDVLFVDDAAAAAAHLAEKADSAGACCFPPRVE